MNSNSNNKFKLKSKYFNYHATDREQSLVNSLIKEAIHINGLNMMYIPRKYVNLDKIYGEDVLSSFEKTFHLVFYVESSESYQGAHSFLGTMGLDIQDQTKLVLSRDVFNEVVVNSPYNEDGIIKKPRVGDLIYNQVMDRIFEIVNVEEFQMFYQLGKQYTYGITVEFFDYSNETIETGIPEIDNKNDEFISTTYEITMKLPPMLPATPYTVGEEVYIGTDLVTAEFIGEVISFNPDTRKLVTTATLGKPIINRHVNGVDSTAYFEIKEFIPINFNDVPKDSTTQIPMKDNEQIQTEADEIKVTDDEDDFYNY